MKNNITYRPTEMTLAEAYASIRQSKLGGALGCLISGDSAGLAAYGFAGREALEDAILAKKNIAIVERESPVAVAPKGDENGWSLEIDHHHQQLSSFGAATIRAVRLTARKDGEVIAIASKPMTQTGRFNGFDVMYAARKLQRKIAKLGFSTIGDTFDIEGFRTLNRASH